MENRAVELSLGFVGAVVMGIAQVVENNVVWLLVGEVMGSGAVADLRTWWRGSGEKLG